MSPREPTVSVVVPCRNDARYLPMSLDSILSQDYPHIECIVVDGASVDPTLDLLEQYGERIRWVSEPDRGAFDAINRGWSLSTGAILTWLNADDLWRPGAVRAVVNFLRDHPETDVVYGTAGVIDEFGRIHGDLVPAAWNLEHALLDCDHVLFQPAAFMTRRILERVNWLHPAWCHDHDLWLRIGRAGGTFSRIPERLAMDRWRAENSGLVASLVIPAKIDLTKRFFAEPGLPPHLQQLRRRAVSNAYLRGIDYLQPGRRAHWRWGISLMAHAVAADPANLRRIGERASRPIRGRARTAAERWRHLLARSRQMTRRLAVGSARRAVRLVTFLPRFVKRAAGRLVERVFVRGQRSIIHRIDSLQHSVDGLRSSTEQHLALLHRQQQAALARLPWLPGWQACDGLTESSTEKRAEQWASLSRPSLSRWYEDLLVALYPDDDGSRMLFMEGGVESTDLTWMRQTLAPGMTMVDVGARRGIRAMFGSRMVGASGLVLAIEPGTREFRRLLFHVELNQLENVRGLHEAVGDADGGGVRALDTVVAAEQLSRLDLLRIDAGGDTLRVLCGAARAMTRFRPRLLLEPAAFAFPHETGSAGLRAFLESLGYTLYELSGPPGYPVPVTGSCGNRSGTIVAVPNESASGSMPPHRFVEA